MTRPSSRLPVVGCLLVAALALAACGGSSGRRPAAGGHTAGAGSAPGGATSAGSASGGTPASTAGAGSAPASTAGAGSAPASTVGAGTAPAGSPTTTAPAAHTPAPGTKTVSDSADRVFLDVPSRWVTITSATQLRALIKRGVTADPALGRLFPQLQTEFAGGVRLAALDIVAGRFADNVNLVVRPAGGTAPAQVGQAEPGLRTRLGQTAGISGLSFATAKATDGGPALRDSYTLRLPGISSVLRGQQLYAIHNDKVYIATVTTAGTNPAATAVLATLRFG